MPEKIIETAKTRRLLAVEKKRMKDDLRTLRHRRMSQSLEAQDPPRKSAKLFSRA